ncbi:MAG TPA: hypothetical protein VH639_12265 [Bryobacteraceae bacterium]
MGAIAGAAAQAAIAEAKKASGVVVRLEPQEFAKLLSRMKEPLIVIAESGIFRTKFQYLIGYKGLAFFTQSADALALPPDAEIVNADSFWMPG